MCCWTHGERDQLARQAGETLDLVAAADQFRCQCEFGQPCQRRATQEDRHCDWCREESHEKFCDEMQPGVYASYPSRVIVDEVSASFRSNKFFGGGLIR